MGEARRGTWGRLYAAAAMDDRLVAVGNEAVGVWTRCLAWCFEHSDGLVPQHIAAVVAGDNSAGRRAVARLVESGLWLPVEGGWRVRNYADCQVSREDRDEARRAHNNRQQRYRERHGDTSPRDAGDDAHNASSGRHVTRHSERTLRVTTEGEGEREITAPSGAVVAPAPTWSLPQPSEASDTPFGLPPEPTALDSPYVRAYLAAGERAGIGSELNSASQLGWVDAKTRDLAKRYPPDVLLEACRQLAVDPRRSASRLEIDVRRLLLERQNPTGTASRSAHDQARQQLRDEARTVESDAAPPPTLTLVEGPR